MLGHPVGRHQVALGRHRDLRASSRLRQLVDEEAITRADLLVCRQAHHDHVDLGPGRLDQIVESLAEQGTWLVQARRVHQHQLGVGPMDDPADCVPGRLRTRGRDRDLLPDECVGQGRFTGVRATATISPTISSRMSSIVTSPAVVPYSSTNDREVDLPRLQLPQERIDRLQLRHEMGRPEQVLPFERPHRQR